MRENFKIKSRLFLANELRDGDWYAVQFRANNKACAIAFCKRNDLEYAGEIFAVIPCPDDTGVDDAAAALDGVTETLNARKTLN